MDEASGEDWSQVARQAIEKHLERLALPAGAPLHPTRTDGDGPPPGGVAEQRRLADAAYERGCTWARDRGATRDLEAMVNAANYRTAVDIVRGTKDFSQRDKFGHCAYPSDELWEAFVDGATARTAGSE